MMQMGPVRLGLLAHPPNPEQNEGQVELNFETSEPLDLVEQRLRAADVTVVQPVTDEGLGRQLQVSTPDGLLIKINALDEEPRSPTCPVLKRQRPYACLRVYLD